MTPFWASVGIIAGMIMGSGLFALPYAISVSGIMWSVVLVVPAFLVVLLSQLSYGEVVLKTQERHRMPGYVKLHLGKTAGSIETVNQILLLNGVLLVYAILAGVFLSQLFSGSAIMWSFGFFVFGGILLLGRAKQIGEINLFLVAPFVVALVAIGLLGAVKGTPSNLPVSARDPFFIFSILLFSLSGFAVIPDAYQIFSRPKLHEGNIFRKAIIFASLLSFVTSAIFAIGVLMASGIGVTKDALSGLSVVLGNGIVQFGAAIGFLAVFTSYLALGYDLKEVYEIDFKVSPIYSWALAVIVPIIPFVFGAQDFIILVSLVGGLFIAIDGIFISLMLKKIRSENHTHTHFVPLGKTISTVLVIIFVFSALYEIVYQLGWM